MMTGKRLIDANALKEWLEILPNATYTDMVLNSIDDLPTIDAVPIEYMQSQVDSGKWEEIITRWREHDKTN